jgi:heat shock protein HslJ
MRHECGSRSGFRGIVPSKRLGVSHLTLNLEDSFIMHCTLAPLSTSTAAAGLAILVLLLGVSHSTALARLRVVPGSMSGIHEATEDPGTGEASDSAPTTNTYRCPAGLILTATFTHGKSASVRIEVGEDVWVLSRVPSASGSKFSNGKMTFWTKGDSARFESPDLSLTCLTVANSGDGSTSLTATAWRLVSISQNGKSTAVPAGITIDATFEDGRVMGRGVCNRYFASYKTSSDGTITVGDVGATLMMCPEHADFERRYFQVLKSSTRFEVLNGTLELSGMAGSLHFVEVR